MDPIGLTNEQKVRVRANPTTASGAPAPIDGALGATLDDPSTGTVEPGVDNLELVIRPAPGFLGTITGRIAADADLGSGVVELADTFTLNVTSAMAVNLGLSAVVEPA
jgi:hypothetical protein